MHGLKYRHSGACRDREDAMWSSERMGFSGNPVVGINRLADIGGASEPPYLGSAPATGTLVCVPQRPLGRLMAAQCGLEVASIPQKRVPVG